MKLLKIFSVLCIIYIEFGLSSKLETVYEWNYLNITPIPSEYGYESYYKGFSYFLRKNGENTMFFHSQFATPVDVDRSQDGRTFVVFPSKLNKTINLNVYASLATVSQINADSGPLVTPYPDYSWFLDPTDCSNITSARGVTIDKCNRLWVLDSGKIGIKPFTTKYCKAKLVVFDLSTDSHVETYEIPDDVANEDGNGVLVNPVIHTTGAQCEKLQIYLADSEGGALVYYDQPSDQFKRLSAPEYKYELAYRNFTISDGTSNLTFSLNASIIPMDISTKNDRLYFAPMASRRLRGIHLSELQDFTQFNKKPDVYGLSGFLRAQPTAFRNANSTDVLFIGLTDNSIDCWHQRMLLEPQDIDTVINDNERLQFISSLKVRENPEDNSEEDLWVITNRLQTIVTRKRNFNEISFRIMKGNVKELVKGTKCEL